MMATAFPISGLMSSGRNMKRDIAGIIMMSQVRQRNMEHYTTGILLIPVNCVPQGGMFPEKKSWWNQSGYLIQQPHPD